MRNCQSKEAEQARVDKELANIRTKFKAGNKLTAYDRKKYCWKLLYIYMLGYEVEFGHMEAVNLVSANTYPEKQVGYMVTTVLLNESHEFIRLVINSIQKDLNSRNENFQCLALNAISNFGGKEFSDALSADVMKVLTNSTVRPVVRKKAALCLLRLYRKNPDSILADSWAPKMTNLLEERDVGVLLGLMTLANALCVVNPAEYEILQPKVVRVLERLTTRTSEIPPEYTYYGIASPWLQIKTMRVLQCFATPEDPLLKQNLITCLDRIVTTMKTMMESGKLNVNKSNTLHGILFEAITLIMHLDAPYELLMKCIQMLGKFVAVREPNVRYLGLEKMGRLSGIAEVQDAVKGQQQQIVTSLRDADISIRRRALDLMYNICDVGNSQEIVTELLQYLTTADFTIREELAIKIAILAERFAGSLRWYVEVVSELIDKAGDFVSEDICHRVIQIVINHEDLQQFAAKTMYDKLAEGSSHETMIMTAGYILGEFGHLLAPQGVTLQNIFAQLEERLPAMTDTTKAQLLSAYMKLLTHVDPTGDADLYAQVTAVFQRYQDVGDAEIQQRAVEYLQLAQKQEAAQVMAAMPKFPERENILMKRIREGESVSEEAAMAKGRAAEQPGSYGPGSAGAGAAAAASAMGGLDLLDTSAPPNGGGDPMKDLMELSSGPAQPVVDPFAAAAPAPAPSGGAQVVGGTVEGWLKKLCVSDKGILYQDQCLQIGVKAEYRQAQGRVMLFFGNKHSAALEGCRCAVNPSPAFKFQLGDLQATIPAQTQVQVPLAVACVAPFTELPTIQISYTVQGQAVNLALKLPIVAAKFLAPVTNVDGPTFFGRWKTIEGPPLKVQEISQLPAPANLPALEQTLQSLQLGICKGFAPPNNVVACATFSTEGGAGGVAMVRLEVDPATNTQFRLTVASGDGALSAAVKGLVLQQLL